jgi:hypothetical protein
VCYLAQGTDHRLAVSHEIVQVDQYGQNPELTRADQRFMSLEHRRDYKKHAIAEKCSKLWLFLTIAYNVVFSFIFFFLLENSRFAWRRIYFDSGRHRRTWRYTFFKSRLFCNKPCQNKTNGIIKNFGGLKMS